MNRHAVAVAHGGNKVLRVASVHALVAILTVDVELTKAGAPIIAAIKITRVWRLQCPAFAAYVRPIFFFIPIVPVSTDKKSKNKIRN